MTPEMLELELESLAAIACLHIILLESPLILKYLHIYKCPSVYSIVIQIAMSTFEYLQYIRRIP